MAAKKSQTYKLGSIIAIPLPASKFAYAKVYRNSDFGVYDLITKKLADVAEVTKHKFLFFQHSTDTPIKKGAWPVIGEEPFADEDQAWGPPRVGGIIPGLPFDPKMATIRERGESRPPASPTEIDGMDSASVCQTADQFIEAIDDRLVRGDHTYHRVKL